MSSPVPKPPGSPSTGLARALSKLGVCSRSQARQFILQGRVRLNGNVCRDPERRVNPDRARIELDSQLVAATAKFYLVLNKPRGLVTSASDEQGRPTVFQCFEGAAFPPLSPVGRLDMASEGLLLFTNDTAWAAQITSPQQAIEKIYHVQVDRVADADLLRKLCAGIDVDGEHLAVARARQLRQGTRNSWLEIVLTEGKNRHIRRLLQALGLEVLRLVRVAVGPLQLGDLPKGNYRQLTPQEVTLLRHAGQPVRTSQPQLGTPD
ncbi:MAG TPA: pseudouridine synthase [Verrucomicrobiae bacterium]|nr:pseudouridine synthase [Verrucomicrobiae bacterium]